MNITQSFVTERDRALLGGDYANYHAQATRTLHTLRKRLGVATPRGRKYAPKAPVTVDDILKSTQWIQLLIASSERAWADAMAMKSSQSPDNTQKPMAGSTKKQIISRHRRAMNYATNLVEILSDNTSPSSAGDLLEAKAYLALLKGGLDFEKSRWISCIQNYAVARLIYTALDTTTKSDLYKDILSNTVDPSVKYAAYQSKFPRTKAVRDIAIENFPSSETSTQSEIKNLDSQAFVTTTEQAASAQIDAPSTLPTTITWRSRKVKIEDASVSQALGLSLDKEALLGNVHESFDQDKANLRELAAAYEEVIDTKQEAVDVTKSAIDELRAQGVEQGDGRIQSLQVTRTAVNYAVIEWRIGRNRVLCGSDDGLKFDTSIPKSNPNLRKEEKPRSPKEESSGRKLARLRERVALYDSTLQSLDAIKELPGIVADTDLVNEVDRKKSYFKALKCLAIGRSHSLNGNIVNALALFSRASDLIEQAGVHQSSVAITTHGPTKLDVQQSQFEKVHGHLFSLTMQYRALAELRAMNLSASAKDSGSMPPLIEQFHLRQYDADLDLTNLVNYPPKLQPIPVKPLFFDLAWNYIQYPGQTKRSTESVAESVVREEPEPKKDDKPVKKGWFGFGR